MVLSASSSSGPRSQRHQPTPLIYLSFTIIIDSYSPANDRLHQMNLPSTGMQKAAVTAAGWRPIASFKPGRSGSKGLPLPGTRPPPGVFILFYFIYLFIYLFILFIYFLFYFILFYFILFFSYHKLYRWLRNQR